VGANGTARAVTLNLGHIEVVEEAELERELDARLAWVRRDVRFLVPESVSGLGVLPVLQGVGGTKGHALVSETVRTGQRAVVISVQIRADCDIDDTIERLRAMVQTTYRWPSGICRPASRNDFRIYYLGPEGTFSETAARQCGQSAGIEDAKLIARPSFDDVLTHAAQSGLAVIPIASSSTGLVSRAAAAINSLSSDLVVGGMVDVTVRLDAFAQPHFGSSSLRGARVFSHPQAIAQCSAFVRRWSLRPAACESTGEALRLAAAAQDGAVALAAAGSDIDDLNLRIFEREVDDIVGAITRFIVLGRPEAFGELSAQFLPTQRALLLGNVRDGIPFTGRNSTAAYEEWLTDAHGQYLVITSAVDALVTDQSPARHLGVAPWSPRTPVVRVVEGPLTG
jgi:prephenate dehydratase